MSDEKEWLKGSIWPKWFKKIEALEKIIGDPVFYKKDIGSIIDYIEKEISELEKKLIGMVNSNTSNQDRIIALENWKAKQPINSTLEIEKLREEISGEKMVEDKEGSYQPVNTHIQTSTNSKPNLIAEFLEDLHYVWNHPKHFNEYMERKKKWEKRQ